MKGPDAALLWSTGGGGGGGSETIVLEVELLKLADRLHPRGWSTGRASRTSLGLRRGIPEGGSARCGEGEPQRKTEV